jgi:cytochrome c oxidase cbb3-type subunit 3
MRFPAVALLCCVLPACAQSERDLADGKAAFRSNCAFCHGLTGGGGRGPALISGRFLHGSTEEEMKSVIRNGVPGSTMPAFNEMAHDELNKLVSFIRSLSGSNANGAPVPGDPAKGRQVYLRNGCPSCHRIGAEGSIFGPELTRVGAGRSTEYIRESIVNPSGDIPDEYQGVTIETRDGKKITGVRLNEDTFSVQLRDPSQTFRLYQKDSLKQVVHLTKSLMPPYPSLPAEDLQDLLAYLDTLRGDLKPGAAVKKADGIR